MSSSGLVFWRGFLTGESQCNLLEGQAPSDNNQEHGSKGKLLSTIVAERIPEIHWARYSAVLFGFNGVVCWLPAKGKMQPVGFYMHQHQTRWHDFNIGQCAVCFHATGELPCTIIRVLTPGPNAQHRALQWRAPRPQGITCFEGPNTSNERIALKPQVVEETRRSSDPVDGQTQTSH